MFGSHCIYRTILLLLCFGFFASNHGTLARMTSNRHHHHHRRQPTRNLQEDETQNCLTTQTTTTQEEVSFSGLLLVDIIGQPGLWTDSESSLLELAVMVAYDDDFSSSLTNDESCQNKNDTSPTFYDVTSITVLSPDEFILGGPLGLDTIRSFSVPVYIEGRTNLTALEGNLTLFAETKNVNNDGNACPEQWCPHPLPTKDEFLNDIQRRFQLNAENIVENITDVHETVAVDCPGNVTEFSSGMVMETVGRLTIDGDANHLENCLATLSESISSLYNYLNILNEDTCDPYFREIQRAIAVVDTTSIRPNAAVDASNFLVPVRRRRRRRTTTTVTNSRKLQDSAGSALPSFQPTTSTSPSTSPTTFAPTTYSPTFKGDDLFAYSILLQLEGVCRGCTSEQNLFDQVTMTRRRTTTMTTTETSQRVRRGDEATEIDSFVDNVVAVGAMDDDGHNDNGRRLFHGSMLTALDGCYCSADAVEQGGPTQDEFFDAWRIEGSLLDDDLACIDSVSAIEEIRVFDCDGDVIEILSYLTVNFVGDLEQLTDAEVETLEVGLVSQYEELASRTCDPFLRSLTSARVVRRGLADDATMLPTSQPSTTPTTSTSSLRRDLQGGGNEEPSEIPSVVPSESPSATSHPSASQEPTITPGSTTSPTLKPTTSQPTFQPTLSVALSGGFYLTFIITGNCRGCQADAGLFDETTLRQRRKRRLSEQSHASPVTWKNAGSRQLQEEGGLCGCGLESPDGSVEDENFAMNWSASIAQLGLPNVKAVVNVEELLDLPSETPTSGVMPSEVPSQSSVPTVGLVDAVFPSAIPSTFSTEFPTADFSTQPSYSPSKGPSKAPTSAITTAPTPSPSTKEPTAVPSPFPSPFPSSSPSQTKSEPPSVLPTGSPSSLPTSSPTRIPTTPPSPPPTPPPTSAPSPTPTSTPTELVCSVPTTGTDLTVPAASPFELPSFSLGGESASISIALARRRRAGEKNDRHLQTSIIESTAPCPIPNGAVLSEFRQLQSSATGVVTVSLEHCLDLKRGFIWINLRDCATGDCVTANFSRDWLLGLASADFSVAPNQDYVLEFYLVSSAPQNQLSWIDALTPGCGEDEVCSTGGPSIDSNVSNQPVLNGGSFEAIVITPPGVLPPVAPVCNANVGKVFSCRVRTIQVPSQSEVWIKMENCPTDASGFLVTLNVFDDMGDCVATATGPLAQLVFVADAGVTYSVQFMLVDATDRGVFAGAWSNDPGSCVVCCA